MLDVEKEIRKLARSDYWQSLYIANKENVNIHLFDNNTNLSGPQLLLLQWIQTYHSLYLDLAKKESQFLTEKVIENDIRCNAYLYHRRKKNEEEWFKYQKKRKEEDLKSRHHFKNEGKVQVIDVDLRNK